MRKVPLLLAVATLIPIGVLGWLGARILQQDRDVERQRRHDALEVAAGRLALETERRLEAVEEQLTQGAGIHLGSTTEEAPPDSLFAEAEAAEFQRQDFRGAAATYRSLTQSGKPDLRAAALVRLGRVLRKSGDEAGALQVYSDLEKLGAVTVEGQPAALLALQARCRVLEETGDVADRRAESAALARALDSGEWNVDRATFDVYREIAQNGGAPPASRETIARIDAAIELKHARSQGNLPRRGRRIFREPNGLVLAVWSGDSVWLASASELEEFLRPLPAATGLAVSLYDTDGQVVFGGTRDGGVTVAPGETRLPFVLSVTSQGTDGGDERMRRTVLIGGLLLAFVLTLGATYGLYRAITRELLVARQQSDFVSAVSHEFRTPLTSMRHLTDLLVSRGVASEERKAQYYELLAHETERLHRMVESLLSFGRIEAGAYAWRLEPANASELVRGTVGEFRSDPQAIGRSVFCEIEADLPSIRADCESLTRALWNLLENAAKYSEPHTPIRVVARRHGDSVLLSVEDEGAGVPPAERERIFQKFVRGTEAKRTGVRGVGIGLALVKRIVEAHGGSVRLESELGRGSTFTVVLPCDLPCPGF
jgi:signal transduction histidine kinase